MDIKNKVSLTVLDWQENFDLSWRYTVTGRESLNLPWQYCD
jgi:hypothetical protein